jgi:hypothetical protein
MLALRLWLWAENMSVSKSMDEFASITASACRPVIGFTSIEASICAAENSDIPTATIELHRRLSYALAFLPGLERLVISAPSKFSP